MARWREKEGKVKVVVQGSEAREGGDSDTDVVVVVTMKASGRVERRLRRRNEVVEGGAGDGGETGHVLPLVVVGGAVEGASFAVVECCRSRGVRRRF